jgi:hypothetical protein
VDDVVGPLDETVGHQLQGRVLLGPGR